MPKTDSPEIDVEAAQKAKLSQDVQETRAAQAEAATETVPGDQLAAPLPVPAEPYRGNPQLADEPAIEDDPELLGRIQDPHAQSRPEVKTAVFTNSYGGKVRAAV